MYQALDQILSNGDYTIVEDFFFPERKARFRHIPRYLFDSRMGSALHALTGDNGGLWNHQSLALEKIGEGRNVVVSTGTASGKSLIFRTAAFHRTLLDHTTRVVVFYPLKALAADQEKGWQEEARRLNLPAGYVGRIDGSVYPLSKRLQILSTAKVVLMTPDVCHAWLMSNLANPEVKRFLRNLSLVVLDEAHILEGVFGSSFSFLFRRIQAARRAVLDSARRTETLDVIAATATITNPAEHLGKLTGLEFHSIGETDDGSPRYQCRCIHLGMPQGSTKPVSDLQDQLLLASKTGGFITFIDSRIGVEKLAVASNRNGTPDITDGDVLPYRAGYDDDDRKNIENRLKRGHLRGVIATSALELGIDIPHLQVGINIGVPPSRKAFRQRLGRVGRCGPGAFLVVAEPTAFTRYGSAFQEYCRMSVEPSYLYTDNRFMQYAHARCLTDELETIGAKEKRTLPQRINWPTGFDQVFATSLPGSNRPREFDAIAQLGADMPQRNYPLRNLAEINFQIGRNEGLSPMGDINLAQALRECYPGATYFHLAKAYKVQRWHTNIPQPFIHVRPVSKAATTKPRIRTWINVELTRQGVVDGHLLRAGDGFLAECQMLITERVLGFEQNGTFHAYDELLQTNPNMRKVTRQFRTTGVILCLDDPWFRNGVHKRALADYLRELFCREYSVEPRDVDAAATNITLSDNHGSRTCSDCIVLFDQTYGSLRLTERAFLDFRTLVDRLVQAANTTGGDDHAFYRQAAPRLERFAEHLRVDTASAPASQKPGDGLVQVFTVGSRVAYRNDTALYDDVTIVMPTLFPDGKLMYQVECPAKTPNGTPGLRWVNAEFLETTADHSDWEYAFWNPDTQRYQPE